MSRFVYGPLGRLERVVDAEGLVTRFVYDQDGRLTTTTVDPAGPNPDKRSRFREYDARGRVTRELGPVDTDPATRDVDFETGGQPARSCVTYEYDGLDRPVKTVVGAAPASGGGCVAVGRTKLLVTWTGYDHAGRVAYTVVDGDGDQVPPTWDPDRTLGAADPEDVVSETLWWPSGRVRERIEPPYARYTDAVSFDWVGGDQSRKRRTVYAYFGNGEVGPGQFPGRVKSVTDPVNTTPSRFEYDGEGRVTRTIQPGGAWVRREFAFDGSGAPFTRTLRPSATGEPGVEVVAEEFFNLDGTLDRTVGDHLVGAPGATVRHRWFDNGLLQGVGNPLGGADNTVSFTYDSRGCRRSRTARTRLWLGAAPAAVTETWAYDLADWVVRYTDPANTLRADTDPAKVVTRFDYSPVTGQLVGVCR